MKFSIKDLILDGHLGGAHTGMERVEVLACLGQPDDWAAEEESSGSESSAIWRYGNFEIHFFPDDSVCMLFIDYLAEPDAGEGRELDTWILRTIPVHTLEAVRAELARKNIDVQVEHNSLGDPSLRTKSGATLSFYDSSSGEPRWSAIVVQGDESEGWADKVYTLPDWYDGPRGGIANFEGRPHLFESTFADLEGEEDIYILRRIDDASFQLALEDWQIWRRWERAPSSAKETTQETHPALPDDLERWKQLQQLLVEPGIYTDPDVELASPPPCKDESAETIHATAEFRPSGTDNGHASLRVRWTRL